MHEQKIEEEDSGKDSPRLVYSMGILYQGNRIILCSNVFRKVENGSSWPRYMFDDATRHNLVLVRNQSGFLFVRRYVQSSVY